MNGASMKILVYTDGACRGNQRAEARSAGIGWRICDSSGNVLEQHAEAAGRRTNNEAEYLAVIRALQKAARYTEGEVVLHSDSELVVRQLKGEYRIREPRLLGLWEKVKAEEKNYKKVSYVSVRREDRNIAAVDRLVNLELDKSGA